MNVLEYANDLFYLLEETQSQSAQYKDKFSVDIWHNRGDQTVDVRP